MDYGIKLVNLDDAIASMGAPEYGDKIELQGGREFVYCYVAAGLGILKGGCVCIDGTGGAAAGQNPRVTVPITSAIPHKYGIAQSAMNVAGGIWVQTKGRCEIAKVDGGSTDIAIGDFLKPVNTLQSLIFDHGTVATASAIGVSEVVEAAALASQTPVTGSPDQTIWLTGNTATVA